MSAIDLMFGDSPADSLELPIPAFLARVAEANLSEQDRLFGQLHFTCNRGQNRVSRDDFAHRLGVDAGEADAVLEGARDLTLSDLRRVAIALGRVVRYSVEELDEDDHRVERVLHVLWDVSGAKDEVDRDVPDEPDFAAIWRAAEDRAHASS